MSEFWNAANAFPTSMLWQMPLLASLGLITAAALRNRPARAHAVLVLALAASVATPLIGLASARIGWGVLAAREHVDASVGADTPRESVTLRMPDALPESALVTASPRLIEDGVIQSVESLEAQFDIGLTAADGPATVGGVTMNSSPDAVRFGFADVARLAGARWELVALTAWGLVSLVLLVRLILISRRAVALVRDSVVVADEALAAALRRGAERARVPDVVDVRVSRQVGGPSIWCWGLRPVVLLPTDWRRAEDADWTAIFAHELAHWRRRDHLWHLLADLIVRCVPWNPLAWRTRAQIDALAERACDDWAVHNNADVTRYADTLLQFVPAARARPGLSAVTSRNSLMTRIPRMLNGVSHTPEAGRAWTIAAALLVVASSTVLAVARPRAVATATLNSDDTPAAMNPRAETVHDDAWYNAQLVALNDSDWRHAFALGDQIASLPPDRGYSLVRNNWDKITDIAARQQLIKAWYFKLPTPYTPRNHPRLVDVLHLGMTDKSPKVQQFALSYLKNIAFFDFANDFSAYTRWRDSAVGKPIEDVAAVACVKWIERLKQGDAEAFILLDDAAATFQSMNSVREAAMQRGIIALLEKIITDGPTAGDRDSEIRVANSIKLYGELAHQADVERVLVPVLSDKNCLRARVAAAAVIGKPGNHFAIEPLSRALIESVAGSMDSRNAIFSLSGSLAEVGDPVVIPLMIGLIASDDTYDTVYGIGYFGLSPLTSVRYDETHNADWWRDWWQKNKARYPEHVRSMALPAFPQTASAVRGSNAATGIDSSSADGTVSEHTIGGDANKFYYLMGPRAGITAPTNGWKLLLVLPGGDGSRDFNPFVTNITREALPDGYIVAQLVAPKWRDDENRIVWPTAKLPDDRMKFSTEEFIADVVKDVASQHTLNRNHVHALGWSSGGPPIYAASVAKDSPLTGAFVAMSVFHPANMAPLDAAKGKSYYLLHSPQDFIKMRFPEDAKAKLGAAGASVKLVQYEGGHGWHGDVFGMIRDGVTWLDAQATIRAKQ